MPILLTHVFGLSVRLWVRVTPRSVAGLPSTLVALINGFNFEFPDLNRERKCAEIIIITNTMNLF